MMRSASRRAARKQQWADAVTDLLAEEFGHDDLTRTVVHNALMKWDGDDPIEIIVDEPIAANWRLKRAADPWSLRLADYRLHARDTTRRDTITARLAAITPPA